MAAQREYEIARRSLIRDRDFPRVGALQGDGDPAVVAVTSMDYQAFFTVGARSPQVRAALSCLRRYRARRRPLSRPRSGTLRTARGTSSSGAPTTISAWASIRRSSARWWRLPSASASGAGGHAQYLRHEPRCRRTRSGTRRPPRQGSGARLHVGLCLEPDRHRHHRGLIPNCLIFSDARQSQLDDRGREPVRLARR